MARESVPSKKRESRKIYDFRNEHLPHILHKDVEGYSRQEYTRGQVITFTYKDVERWVFVVHPEWEGKIHGLDMRYIPRRDLLPLFDVTQALAPEQFYKTYVDKPWVKRWDAYRTYDRTKISNVKVVVYNTAREPDELSEPRMDDTPEFPVVPDEDIL